MKAYLSLPLIAAALLLTAPATEAEDKAGAPGVRPVLAIVVVDHLDHRPSTAFDRLDLAFKQVARERKWPVDIATGRFAANTPSYDPELLIVNQPLRRGLGPEVSYRGWMILTVQGVKHDFGIVSYRYTPRPFEQEDDALEKIFLGAANAAADKIEPILFPKPTSQAEDKAGAPSVRPVLVIVVVSNGPYESVSTIEYVDDIFQQIAWQRKWPMEIRTERFASNTPSYDYELLYENGWMILTVQGVKHDLGHLGVKYGGGRLGLKYDLLDYDTAADKIERILFPKPTRVDRPRPAK